MTLNAVDLSNFSGPLTARQAQGLKAAGVVLAIIQAVDPPTGYPPGVTRQQIQACLEAGLVVDAYVWLWFDLDVGDVRRKLALLDGLSIRRLWLDVEDQAAAKYDQELVEAKVQAALVECDAFALEAIYPDRHTPTGIYTGRWFWTDGRYMGNSSTFSDRDLWDANYDHVDDAAQGFVPYGGWESCAIKQYQGDAILAGVSGIDLNALSEGELARVTNPPSADPRDTRIDQLLSTIGVMGGDVADSLENTGAVLHKQAAAKRMNRIQIGGSANNIDSVVKELRRLRADAP